MMRASRDRRLDGIGKGGERRVERRKLDLPLLDTFQRQADRREQPAKTGIGGEGAEQRLCRDQLIGNILHFVDRKKEQTVTREELAAIRSPDRPVKLLPVAQPLRQVTGGIFGLARTCRIDDEYE